MSEASRDALAGRALRASGDWTAVGLLRSAHASITEGDLQTARWLVRRASLEASDAYHLRLARALWTQLAQSASIIAQPSNSGRQTAGRVARDGEWAVGHFEAGSGPRAIDVEIDGRFLHIPVSAGAADDNEPLSHFRLRLPGDARVVRIGRAGRQFAGSPLVLRRGPEAIGRPTLRSAPPSVVWVLVPVYGAGPDVRRCLDSLLRSRNDVTSRVLVVDDASEDAGLVNWLADLAGRGSITLLRRPINGGFVAAVNTGLRALGATDVVLLNSDTVVADRWLDRLHAASRAAPDIGAVNPISNNAELLSVPEPMHAGAMPSARWLAIINQHLATRHAAGRLQLPAGVGFCWYLRGEALRDVGLLDETMVRGGYGEDTDLSVRLERHGWRVTAALDTYVAHAGGGSFGQTKGPLALQNVGLLRARFPEHGPAYRRFLSQGRLGALARQLQRDLLGSGAARGEVLLCTDQVAWKRRLRFSTAPAWGLLPQWSEGALRGVSLVAASVAGLNRIEYAWPGQRDELLADLTRAEFGSFVRETFADWAPGLISEVRAAAARYEARLVDASAYCPRRHAHDSPRSRCAEPVDVGDCRACIAAHGALQRGADDLERWRAHARRDLEGASIVRAGSREVARRLKARIGRTVVPSATRVRGQPRVPSPPGRKGAARIAIIGIDDLGRGFALIDDLAQAIDRAQSDLRLVILGESFDDRRLARNRCVELPGAVRAEELVAMLTLLACDSLAEPGFSDDGLVRAVSAETGLPLLVREDLEQLLLTVAGQA